MGTSTEHSSTHFKAMDARRTRRSTLGYWESRHGARQERAASAGAGHRVASPCAGPRRRPAERGGLRGRRAARCSARRSSSSPRATRRLTTSAADRGRRRSRHEAVQLGGARRADPRSCAAPVPPSPRAGGASSRTSRMDEDTRKVSRAGNATNSTRPSTGCSVTSSCTRDVPTSGQLFDNVQGGVSIRTSG